MSESSRSRGAAAGLSAGETAFDRLKQAREGRDEGVNQNTNFVAGKNASSMLGEPAAGAEVENAAANDKNGADTRNSLNQPKRHWTWADFIVAVATIVIATTGVFSFFVSKDTLSEIENSTSAAKTSADAALVASKAASEQAGVMRDTLAQMKLDSAAQSSQFASQLSVVKNQVAASGRMADANERASFANRAWLSVHYLEMGEPREFVERVAGLQGAMKVKFLIQNHGITPARINELQASLYIVPSPGSLEPVDSAVIRIDPDNPAQYEYRTSDVRHAIDLQSGRDILGYSTDMFSGGGVIRQELMILGNGGTNTIEVEFIFTPPYGFFERDSGEVLRFDYWLHVEVPYLDVFQMERRTCFFAHVDGSDAFLADHIPSDRHNYQR